MPLSVAIPFSVAVPFSLFEAVTFHLVSRKTSLFFHCEAQSFNSLKPQELISAAFSRFQ